MNRKILIAVLPVLLVISACQASPKAKANNLFLEDTLAHEEVFGNVKLEERSLQPKRLDDPVEHPEANNFSIGVQSQSESAGCISFRFVAAVKFADSELDPTQAVWTRTVSYTDGNVKKEFGTFPSTKAYKSLSNGGSAYSIDDYNGAHGLTGNNAYTHFVVYTLRNVPVDSNDYYVSTYLTLSTKEGESGGKELTSKAVAINASQTGKFVYDLGDNGAFFIEGTFNGNHEIRKADRIRTSDNYAEFDGVIVKENDSFTIKEFFNTNLYVHNATQVLKGNTNPIRYYFDDDSGNIKSNFNGTYDLYFTRNTQLWTSANPTVNDTQKHLYVYLENDWYLDGDTFAAIYAFGSNGNHWYKLQSTQSYNTWLKTADKVDTSKYNTIIVVRMKSSADPDNLSWDDQAYGNQTGDLALTNATEDCAYVYSDGSGKMGLRIVD